MASPNLTTDCTATPQFPLPETDGYSSKAIIFEDDSAVSYTANTTKHRRFKLSYKNQKDSEWQSFKTFFDARLGQRDFFYWNNPLTGETDLKVRFASPSVTYTFDSPTTRSWDVEIILVSS
jgi:hypothetical protein